MVRRSVGLAILAAAILLAGCGSSHEVIRVTPEHPDRVEIPGESRIRYRSGLTRTVRALTVREGNARWYSAESWDESRPLMAPVWDLDAVQLKNTGAGIGRGLGFGMMIGVLIGIVVEHSNGEQGNIYLDESDRTLLSGITGGLIGGLLGGAIGGSVGVWEDRYVFDAADDEIPDGVSP